MSFEVLVVGSNPGTHITFEMLRRLVPGFPAESFTVTLVVNYKYCLGHKRNTQKCDPELKRVYVCKGSNDSKFLKVYGLYCDCKNNDLF